MCVPHLINILRLQYAAFFIAVLIMSLTMNLPSVEANPSSSSRLFDDHTSVVSKEDAHHLNQQCAQFEPDILDRLRNRIDSGFLLASAKVRFDDRRPEQPIAEENRDSGATGTPTRRTVTVTSTRANRDENEPATPIQTTPVATVTEKAVPDGHHHGPAWSPWLLIILVAAVLVIIWRILGRRITEKTPSNSDSDYKPPIYPPRIAIKFRSGGGQAPQHLDGWQISLGSKGKLLAPLQVFPLFESLDSLSLRELIDSALENDPSYKPPDLSAWFQIETPPGLNAYELLTALRKLDKIETSYLMRPVPPPGAADNPLNPLQTYEGAAPDGIDARYAWGFIGGDGAGIGFVDLETAWDLNHQDLKDANITIISGRNHGDHRHGTSVLGQVVMVDNTKGGLGIAPSAQARVISQWRTRSSYNTADAIAHAATKMSPGDVLLLEAQEFDPNGGEGDEIVWPVEIADASYEAISVATAKGIVVIEAGANGGQDLDTYKNAEGKKIFDRTSPNFRDSNAIMVGAGSSAHPHSRLAFSNYGNRVDCYAWGENIETTSTNIKGKANTMYRGDFRGTSGASPMIAGSALILQGIRQAALDRGALGKRFTPQQLRSLLTANGTPSKTPATDKIGVMPDLRAIITHNSSELSPIPISISAPS